MTRTSVIAETTHVWPLELVCCVVGTGKPMQVYMDVAVAAGTCFLLALAILLGTPSPMPRALS